MKIYILGLKILICFIGFFTLLGILKGGLYFIDKEIEFTSPICKDNIIISGNDLQQKFYSYVFYHKEFNKYIQIQNFKIPILNINQIIFRDYAGEWNGHYDNIYDQVVIIHNNHVSNKISCQDLSNSIVVNFSQKNIKIIDYTKKQLFYVNRNEGE